MQPTANPPMLRVIRGLGGNGGTFLSRALAAMDGVLLLSETNPASANLFGFGLNPLQQIRDHYHQLALSQYPENLTELGDPKRFGRFIEQLAVECAEHAYHLIIRDYNYADYIGTPFIWKPTLCSSLDAALPGWNVRDLLLIRHPASQYASLLAHGELKNVLRPEDFLAGYRHLLVQHPTARPLRYEDLFSDFAKELAGIADYFELTADRVNWEFRLPEIDWMTGHVRGQHSSQPQHDRLAPPPETQDLLRHMPDYHVICRHCGYEP